MHDHLATLVDEFRRTPQEIAVVRYQGNRRRVSTYGDLAHLACKFAALLEDRGIGMGDRVLLWAENSAEWIAAFHGCIRRGVIVVPLDAYGSPDFAQRVLADVEAKLAVGDAHLLHQLAVVEKVAFEEWESTLPERQAESVLGISRETPLQILFTSGTTGDPKGIVHTHGNVIASVEPIARGAQPYMRYEKYVHPLRILHTLPLSHVFGQTMGLWVPPIFRAELHFESRLVAPRLIETIKRERISVLAAVPRVFALLKTHLESTIPDLMQQVEAWHNFRAWKKWWRFRSIHSMFGFKFWALISGGGALPPQVEHFWNALGFVLIQGYGMTETTALITLNHPFHVARGTIGKPLPGREVKIGADGEVLVRGPMISSATWQGGQLRQRTDEWLPTGDLAEKQETGELKFLGRKSEVIVTGTGVNIHPEDLEAVIEESPAVAACAVVPIETPAGPEPCAVIAMRAADAQPAAVIEHANAQLPEFQRVRRWLRWPEPDLPRTSTGKVRRRAVAEWVASHQAGNGRAGTRALHHDWLLQMIAQITGETPQGSSDDMRLSEDLHLDSLGRVQLAAAIEQKLGMAPESGLLEEVQTLGELRALAGGARTQLEQTQIPKPHQELQQPTPMASPVALSSREPSIDQSSYIFPRWSWSWPVTIVRFAFLEGVMRPLVWFLADPRTYGKQNVDPQSAPMLIIANHVTTYDGPLVQYALPGRVRRAVTAAMSGEMLEDFRHARNPYQSGGRKGFYPLGPAAWFLLTALFNVFPLPRSRDIQRSFAHAGAALDSGHHVLVFPEGTRSPEGHLAPFRPGIGLLVKQSNVSVLPVAIRGLGELKTKGRGWFRSGKIEVRVGQSICFAPEAGEAEITRRLHAAVDQLLNG